MKLIPHSSGISPCTEQRDWQSDTRLLLYIYHYMQVDSVNNLGRERSITRLIQCSCKMCILWWDCIQATYLFSSTTNTKYYYCHLHMWFDHPLPHKCGLVGFQDVSFLHLSQKRTFEELVISGTSSMGELHFLLPVPSLVWVKTGLPHHTNGKYRYWSHACHKANQWGCACRSN